MTHLQRHRLNRTLASFQRAARAVLADPSDYRSECAARTLAHDLHRLRQPVEEPPVIGLVIRRDQH